MVAFGLKNASVVNAKPRHMSSMTYKYDRRSMAVGRRKHIKGEAGQACERDSCGVVPSGSAGYSHAACAEQVKHRLGWQAPPVKMTGGLTQVLTKSEPRI